MNIGKLDTYVGVYGTNGAVDAYGSYKTTTSNFIDNAWLKKIPKKSFMTTEAKSSMVNENTFEFMARYNESLFKPGYYFQISGSTIKYYIRGVEEVGRKEGMKLYVESKVSRSI